MFKMLTFFSIYTTIVCQWATNTYDICIANFSQAYFLLPDYSKIIVAAVIVCVSLYLTVGPKPFNLFCYNVVELSFS